MLGAIGFDQCPCALLIEKDGFFLLILSDLYLGRRDIKLFFDGDKEGVDGALLLFIGQAQPDLFPRSIGGKSATAFFLFWGWVGRFFF